MTKLSGPLKYVRAHPELHQRAMAAKHRAERALRAPHRVGARRALEGRTALNIHLTQAVGMGGVLLQCGLALELADNHGVDAHVEFHGPTYRPSGFDGDWLDIYFDRTTGDRRTKGRSARLSDLMNLHQQSLDVRRLAPMVWDYLKIKPDLTAAAERYLPSSPFLAAHFRGSDKRLEVARAGYELIFELLDRQVERHPSWGIMVASDETQFIQHAIDRYGRASVYTLPQEAVALDGVPPHFSSVDGLTKGREALVAMTALARSQVLIRTESFLSEWAHSMSTNQEELVARPV